MKIVDTSSKESKFPGGSDSKESACNAGDLGSIPGLGRSPGEGNGNPLQYYCLENPMDRGTWQAISPWGCRVRHDLVTEIGRKSLKKGDIFVYIADSLTAL